MHTPKYDTKLKGVAESILYVTSRNNGNRKVIDMQKVFYIWTPMLESAIIDLITLVPMQHSRLDEVDSKTIDPQKWMLHQVKISQRE